MKKIPIEDLEEGMVVVKSDKPWLKLPFFGGPVADAKFIRILKNYGVKNVFIKEDEQITTELEQEFHDKILLESEKIESTDFHLTIEEIERLKNIHSKATKITKNIFTNAKVGKAIDTDQAKDVVKTFVDSCFKKPSVATSLSRLKNYDDYTFVHSINVCVLAIAMGKKLGLDGIELQRLGMGALLHDIGKMHVPDEILNKPGNLTDEEFEIMKQHPKLGYDYLIKQDNIPEDALQCVLHHHERSDGGGYPDSLLEKDITKFAKITSIVDTYDAITSDRVYCKGTIPTEALKMIFGWSGTRFNKLLVHFFLDILGIYPVGTLVLLDTGELAIVFEANRKDPGRPRVLIISNKVRKTINPYLFDLSSYNLITQKPYKTILAPLDHRKLNIEPNKLIDKFVLMNKSEVKV